MLAAFKYLLKNFIFLSFLVTTSLTSCAQPANVVGEYYSSQKSSAMAQDFRLSLNSDGTFEFNQRWNQKIVKQSWNRNDRIQSTGNEKGKGKWTSKNSVIIFTSNAENDLNQDYRLNFDGTKAKFLNDSTIIFMVSKLFWAENLSLKRK